MRRQQRRTDEGRVQPLDPRVPRLAGGASHERRGERAVRSAGVVRHLVEHLYWSAAAAQDLVAEQVGRSAAGRPGPSSRPAPRCRPATDDHCLARAAASRSTYDAVGHVEVGVRRRRCSRQSDLHRLRGRSATGVVHGSAGVRRCRRGRAAVGRAVALPKYVLSVCASVGAVHEPWFRNVSSGSWRPGGRRLAVGEGWCCRARRAEPETSIPVACTAIDLGALGEARCVAATRRGNGRRALAARHVEEAGDVEGRSGSRPARPGRRRRSRWSRSWPRPSCRPCRSELVPPVPSCAAAWRRRRRPGTRRPRGRSNGFSGACATRPLVAAARAGMQGGCPSRVPAGQRAAGRGVPLWRVDRRPLCHFGKRAAREIGGARRAIPDASAPASECPSAATAAVVRRVAAEARGRVAIGELAGTSPPAASTPARAGGSRTRAASRAAAARQPRARSRSQRSPVQALDGPLAAGAARRGRRRRSARRRIRARAAARGATAGRPATTQARSPRAGSGRRPPPRAPPAPHARQLPATPGAQARAAGPDRSRRPSGSRRSRARRTPGAGARRAAPVRRAAWRRRASSPSPATNASAQAWARSSRTAT